MKISWAQLSQEVDSLLGIIIIFHDQNVTLKFLLDPHLWEPIVYLSVNNPTVPSLSFKHKMECKSRWDATFPRQLEPFSNSVALKMLHYWPICKVPSDIQQLRKPKPQPTWMRFLYQTLSLFFIFPLPSQSTQKMSGCFYDTSIEPFPSCPKCHSTG